MSGHAEGPAGSPAAGEPAFLAIGKVRRPHGVTGDVLVEVYTDFPERLQAKTIIYAGEKHHPLTIRRQRNHNDGILLAFDGFTTPEQVRRFRNQVLYIAAAEASVLPEGEFYYHELVGLSVVDEAGEHLGKVTEIMQTGANDVYVVTNDSEREILLPAIAEVILEVDLVARKMKVHLLPGLVEHGDREV
jgi:16S rRNA processing protein RimM